MTKNKSFTTTKRIHLYAVDSSDWTREELGFLDETELTCMTNHKLHTDKAHQLTVKDRRVTFIANVLMLVVGTSGLIKVFNNFNWTDCILFLLAFCAGVANLVSSNMDWRGRALEHDLAADRYFKHGTETRLARSMPNLERSFCSFIISRLAYNLTEANTRAPWIDDSKINQEQIITKIDSSTPNEKFKDARIEKFESTLDKDHHDHVELEIGNITEEKNNNNKH